MGTIKYTNNGITYNNVVAPVKSLKATISRDGYKNEAGELVDDDYNGQIVEPTKFINAIDIDWNGAELAENVIISDTSDLLNNLKGKANTSDVYTKEESDEKYLTEHQDISGKANTSDVYTKEESDEKYLTEHQDISGKANVGDSYTKEESDAKYLTEHQDISGLAVKSAVDAQIDQIAQQLATHEQQAESTYATQGAVASLADNVYTKEESDAKYLTEHQSLTGLASETYVNEQIAALVGSAPKTLDTLEEIATALQDNATMEMVTNAISTKANVGDSYTKEESDAKYLTEHQDITGKANVGDSYTKEESDAKYLTEHQDISGLAVKSAVDAQIDQISQQLATHEQQAADTYATKEQLEAIVGVDVPENFDTLKELADAMGDLKVVDVEAVEPVEGVHWTQEEIDAAVEGDEAYGKTTDDWKVEPVEGVEEVSHNMTIGEFVTSSMEAVDEKAEIAKVQVKYNALLSLLNLRETDVNNVIINEELANSSTVTFDEPVDNIVIPQTTTAYTVTAPLADDSTVTLTSNKYMTLDNTSEEPVSATVQRPAEAGETGTSGTTVYLVGQYDTLTLENVSPNVKSGRDAAKANNVIITENNTKNLTLNLDLQDGATITNNSATAVTINDKNNEETVLAIVAPNSTVTLNGGTYTTLDAEVSDNTLVIKKNAHIGTLNVTKGNVKVEVPRESDIANIIDTLNIAEGYSVDYLHDDITSTNISKLTTTGTHTLQEDISKSGNFSVGLFSSDDMIWDLNGHNLTSSNTRGYGIFTLRGTAQLEINDSVGTGIIKNTTDDYGFWTSTVGSKVIINGGNFEASTHVLYAQRGTIEVNGGTFKLTNAATADKDQNGNFKFLLNCHDEDYTSGDAKIIVRGGKFYGFNPACTYGEPNGPVSYVPEGYESVPTNEAYEYGTVYEVRKIAE